MRRSNISGSTDEGRSASGNRSRMSCKRNKVDPMGCLRLALHVWLGTRKATTWDGGKFARSWNPALTVPLQTSGVSATTSTLMKVEGMCYLLQLNQMSPPSSISKRQRNKTFENIEAPMRNVGYT